MAVDNVRPDNDPDTAGRGKNYKWIALSNTTLGILMVTINQSILLISLPALFRGIQLNPLIPPTRPISCGSSWVHPGHRGPVVSLGRVGDIYAGSACTTSASPCSRSSRSCSR